MGKNMEKRLEQSIEGPNLSYLLKRLDTTFRLQKQQNKSCSQKHKRSLSLLSLKESKKMKPSTQFSASCPKSSF